MPKVLCTLENASTEISGHKFTAVEGGMLSEDLDDDTAARFLSIPGYEPVADPEPPAEPQKPAAAPAPAPKPAAKQASKKAATPAPEPAPAPAAEQTGGSAATDEQPADQKSEQTGGDDDPDAVF